jgi:cell division protein FtsN
MARARRAGKAGPKKRRRIGTILFIIGILAVLGGTFAAGALAGRLSLKPMSVVNATRGPERAPKPVALPSPPPPPELTFYRELTAPLTPPPLPPKPAPRAATKKDAAPAEAPPKPEPSAPSDTAPASPAPAAGRYTVQVASYNVRAQAEALRARLAEAGHEAYVAEGDAVGITRYRVRIGAFTTMEEARQAAGRLESQAQVATYVTTR